MTKEMKKDKLHQVFIARNAETTDIEPKLKGLDKILIILGFMIPLLKPIFYKPFGKLILIRKIKRFQ